MMPWKNRLPGCTGKRGYPTYERARKTADHFGQRVYRCPICRFYHLTERDPRHRKGAEDRARRSRRG